MLYELVLDHLSGIGDFWIAVEEKDFAKAERLGIEFGEDFRLLEGVVLGRHLFEFAAE